MVPADDGHFAVFPVMEITDESVPEKSVPGLADIAIGKIPLVVPLEEGAMPSLFKSLWPCRGIITRDKTFLFNY